MIYTIQVSTDFYKKGGIRKEIDWCNDNIGLIDNVNERPIKNWNISGIRKFQFGNISNAMWFWMLWGR